MKETLGQPMQVRMSKELSDKIKEYRKNNLDKFPNDSDLIRAAILNFLNKDNDEDNAYENKKKKEEEEWLKKTPEERQKIMDERRAIADRTAALIKRDVELCREEIVNEYTAKGMDTNEITYEMAYERHRKKIQAERGEKLYGKNQ